MVASRGKSVQYCPGASRNEILGAPIKMCKILFLIFVFCLLRLYVVKADIDPVFDDAECLHSSDEYIKPDSCRIWVNDDSEYGTTLSAHLEIIKKFPEGVLIQANLNGLEMGEYTNDIGLHVETDVCKLISDPHNIAAPVIKVIGLDRNNCPPEPGVYGQDNFVIDDKDGFPETFPIGKYLLNMTLLKAETVFVHIHLYVSV